MTKWFKYSAALAMLTGTALAAPQSGHGFDMDYGPFLSYSVLASGAASRVPARKPAMGNPLPPWKAGDLLATKGITVKLDNDAAICFDTDTCRYAAGWVGGFVDVSHSNLVRDQGPLPVIAKGTLVFTTDDGPGWTKDGSFKDPRRPDADSRVHHGEGPLPRNWAHYDGLYRSGDHVVFAYTVGSSHLLDMPGVRGSEDHLALTRTLYINKSDAPLRLRICNASGGVGDSIGTHAVLTVTNANIVICVGVTGPERTHLHADGKAIELTIPPVAGPTQVTIIMAQWPAVDSQRFDQMLRVEQGEADLTTYTKGGPPLWKEEIETTGTIAPDSGPYVVDTVALPENNPWHSWIKPGGFDFFPDGRAAVATFSGDVWIVSGLDAKLDHVKWKRFAAGLYEPLGLKIFDNTIYVLGRDQITRLRDLNDDGEADFYENFNNDAVSDANYHSFHMDLQTDREGNFYYTVTGNQMPLAKPDHSCVMKVSKYGDKCEVVAAGLRAANGLGMGPNDELTVADNQGHWVPASPIFMVKPDGFYGYHGDPRRVSDAEFAAHIRQHPKTDPPLCWVPYPWDNSSGGQVWAASGWGPLSGHMLHTSYGKCAMLAVLPEQVDGVWQGGVVQLPMKFDSGIMRGRVNPVDGQVWVCGLRGWQTSANKDGCLQRVRYTGKPFYLATEMHVTNKGIRVSFPMELDAETTKDPGSYSFEAWTYQWSEKYGSDDYKISNPTVKGHDTFEVTRATLSADKRSVLVEVAGLKPVPQYILKMRLHAADGTPIKCDIGGTINKIGRGN